MKTIRAKIANQLYEQMAALVDQGWFLSQDAIINEALRRFLEYHRPEQLEKSIREDVEWGLHSKQ
jgi:Arc/MetJ-type ribon-helix-helix transcriptional regulator